MVAERDIRNLKAKYHRNGVAGVGFFSCAFEWRDPYDGRKWRTMHAIIFEQRGYCAVTDPTDCVKVRWRGDTFEDLLRQLVERLGDEVYTH